MRFNLIVSDFKQIITRFTVWFLLIYAFQADKAMIVLSLEQETTMNPFLPDERADFIQSQFQRQSLIRAHHQTPGMALIHQQYLVSRQM
jgi:hypothetical protein